ncbi:MAG: hypothetical protein ACRC7G_16715, partial [Beijerinckiaceae bacterium]
SHEYLSGLCDFAKCASLLLDRKTRRPVKGHAGRAFDLHHAFLIEARFGPTDYIDVRPLPRHAGRYLAPPADQGFEAASMPA